jgi:subtilisin family serine protease
MMPSCRLLPAVLLPLTFLASGARADDSIMGARLVRLLGDRAQSVFAPNADGIGALVTLPAGASAEALGLEPFVPGYGRLHVRPADLLAYADAHPDLTIEVAPPLHSLLNKAGEWIHSTQAHERGMDGSGVLVGVADTGLDVTLADFKDPSTGKSRVAWILDLSLPAQGIYPELEKKFCAKNGAGVCVSGAVLQGTDIDALDANPDASAGKIPIDEDGHGTHVTSIAAGNGGPMRKYVGGAPGAQIVFARVTRDITESFVIDDVLTGVAFLFDRADFMALPIAANLSIGTDFGPHDGSMSWEKSLASFVGESEPGHALVIAAGNSGSIDYTSATSPIHQTVHVSSGSTVSVPIDAVGPQGDGEVDVWVTFAGGSSISVGLDGPGGIWVAPVANGQTGNDATSFYTASVVNGSTASGSQVPSGSNGAVVIWTGTWPTGTYSITLQGDGTADLWMQSSLTSAPNFDPLGFAYGVREGTINLPATQPSLIAVGCTVNRTEWTAIDGQLIGYPSSPGLDQAGGLPSDASAPFLGGEVCWFSSAGPTVTGVPKPEISAPGAFVVGAMSTQAPPSSQDSIFYDTACPPKSPESSFVDPRCLQVDSAHAVAEGTSMSAPMVTGAIALMFQRDPTLTQTQLVPVLQGGAHYFRSGFDEFEDQGGPGELDILGSFQVMSEMSDPAVAIPATCESGTSCKSWLNLSTDYLLADGSTPTVAIVELRNGSGQPADLFEPSRLQAVVRVDGVSIANEPSVARRGPGVWAYSVTPPPGFGGQAVTFGATFDGTAIVVPHTIPIATDPWTAAYVSAASGSSCSVAHPGRRGNRPWIWVPLACLVGLVVTFRRKRLNSPPLG